MSGHLPYPFVEIRDENGQALPNMFLEIHLKVDQTHFINPGSVGRMFDGDPSASCAILTLSEDSVKVNHFRVSYTIDRVIKRLRKQQLPTIYEKMYQTGRKLN
jgi:diadenosine tetraphosphatase ApaH/serine/threonine PP2A family protein phosphatase